MSVYSEDEPANGSASFGTASTGLFFGQSGVKAHSPSPAPSPNSTLISPAGNSSREASSAASADQAILQHLYNSFLSGSYADLTLRFHGAETVAEFHLHRMIVARSPLIQQMLQQGAIYDLTIPINDPNITSEGLTTCLGSLYSSQAREGFANVPISEDPKVQSTFLRSVLASALLLKLPDLAQLAVDLIKADLNRRSVIDYIAFVSHPDFVEFYQPYAKDIRDTIFTYLCKLAVREIANQGLEGAANLWANKGSEAHKELVRLFAELPFEWLKMVVETKTFEMPSDKERHDFARQVIALRAQTHSPNRPHIVAGEENVVLAFGGKDNNKSGVTIVRKARPQTQPGYGVRQTGLMNGNGPIMNGHEGRRIWKIGD